MAKIKCKLKDGKLEVVHVEKFEPNDQILFEKPIGLFAEPDDCLIVKVPFAPGRTLEKRTVDPCPGSKPA